MTGFRAWLKSVALDAHYDQFVSNSIDLDVITELTENDLAELGFDLGDRKRIMRAINDLRNSKVTSPTSGIQRDVTTLNTGVASNDASERRQLTLMFVDLVGSTEMATALDLEDYTEALHLYQNCCQDIVRARYGHVANMIGDGIVCYFGYPKVEENDAERAVFAALEICSAVSRLRASDGRALQVRIGISSGDVVVDHNTLHGGLALGEVPNLAARVEAITEPGTVAISDSTKQLIGDNITCEWMGRHKLKGFEEEIGIWQVLAVGGIHLRFQARRGGQRTPLVNRVDELHLLDRQWQLAREGRGRAVMLSGEAGIGKSRLVEAIREQQSAENCISLGFQCLPNHETSPYFPVISFLVHLAGIDRSDDPPTRLSKLRQLVSSWFAGAEHTVEVLASLLSLPSETTAQDDGDKTPEQSKERLQETLIETVLTLSERQPVLLLFEDIHWIDPSTEEVIDLLIDRLDTARVLVVCTFRPQYRPRWTGLAGVTSLTLPRLDNEHMGEMLDNLIDTKDVSLDIQAQILSKTDGIPLFMEEMTRLVRDRYAGAAQNASLTLPTTLKELLQATIDRIDPARALLPICAAIGNNIMPAMVHATMDTADYNTQGAIDQLVEEQILVPRGSGSNSVYSFRHSLIREAAYELMLPSRVRRLHRRIAEVMSSAFADLASDQPEVLAQHYSLAQMPAKARDAWRKAADVSMRRSATEETIQHLRAALGENDKLDDKSEQIEQEILLRKKLNLALDTRAFGSKEVVENFRRLYALIGESDAESKDSFLALHVQFGAQMMYADPQSALVLCDDLDRIAARTSDPTMQTIAAHDAAMCDFMLGNLEEALAGFDRALALRSLTSRNTVLAYHAADVGVVDIAMRAWARALLEGDNADVRAELEAATAEARAEPHEFSRCFGLNILATAFQVLGDSATLLDLVAEALVISQKHRFRYWDAWSGILRGWARAHRGEYAAGTAELLVGIDNYLATGSTQIILYARTLLADTYRMAGAVERGLLAIEQVREDEKTLSVRYQSPLTDRIEAGLRKLKA
ncbi:MAG: adenylate/guanylate cyclase domain-containing protein [Pseudomonadota bacterium]